MKKAILYFIPVALILSLLQSCESNQQNDFDELTLADASVVWWMAPGIIAQEDSIYKKNKLNIKSFDVQTGLASKNAVLSNSADIGLVASTPLALGAFNNDDLIILCSYVESKSLLGVITKKNNDAATYSKPEPDIAVVKGTISELYLYNYLNKYYPNDKENLMKKQLNVKPPDIPHTISEKGSANAAVIWEPFATNIATDTMLKMNRSTEVYTHRIYVVTTPKTYKEKKAAIKKFVTSIEDACNSINNNREHAQKLILNKFNNQDKSMYALWDKVDFSVKYDYDKMKELILKDAEAAFELKQTPKDNNGNCRKLTEKEVNRYFNHDFK